MAASCHEIATCRHERVSSYHERAAGWQETESDSCCLDRAAGRQEGVACRLEGAVVVTMNDMVIWLEISQISQIQRDERQSKVSGLRKSLVL